MTSTALPADFRFNVADMSCGHCVSSITRAVKAVDPLADVQVDLNTKQVQIRSAAAGAGTLGDAIAEAGFTPIPVHQAP